MIGQTVSHYRIVEKLGQGGMGIVYRAEDTTLGRQVAIKVLPEAFAEDPERMARFEREAKLLASLSHQNVASIFGLEEADGKRFICSRNCTGRSLLDEVDLLGFGSLFILAFQNPHDRKDCVPVACGRRHTEQLVHLAEIADRFHVATIHSKDETVLRCDYSHEPLPPWRKRASNISRAAAVSGQDAHESNDIGA